MVQVIIIGAGPAGITASLYLHRSNIKTIVLHNNKSNLQKAYQIDNYYGIPNVGGDQLYQTGIKQAKSLGIDIREEEVIEISYDKEGYKIKTNQNTYESKYVILASGKTRKQMKIPGLKENIGMGVSYCAICDAFFYKNKRVALIGEGSYVLHEKEILEKTCEKVYVISKNLKDSIQDTVKKVEKKEKFLLSFESGNTLEVDGIFIALGMNDMETLASVLGLKVEQGFIKVNEHQQTNLKNFYACGDITGGILQISTATYEGMKAALHIIKNGKEEKNESD